MRPWRRSTKKIPKQPISSLARHIYKPGVPLALLFYTTMNNKITLPPILDIFNKDAQAPQRMPLYPAMPVYSYHYMYNSGNYPNYAPSYPSRPSSYALYNSATQAASPEPVTAPSSQRASTAAVLPTTPAARSPESTASPEASSMSSRARTRNNLPKETTYVLLKWLNEHLNHPYPNSFEKTQLMMTTGLNQQQLSNWFINARRRKIKVLRQKQKSS